MPVPAGETIPLHSLASSIYIIFLAPPFLNPSSSYIYDIFKTKSLSDTSLLKMDTHVGRTKSNMLVGRSTLDRWRQYPANIGIEPDTINLQSYSQTISDIRSSIFSESSIDTNVEIIDIIGKNKSTYSMGCSNIYLKQPKGKKRPKPSKRNIIRARASRTTYIAPLLPQQE